MSTPGLLLTGGAGSRMGRNKATVAAHGATLAEITLARLADVCDPVIELGPGYTGVRFLEDRAPHSGPLHALAGAAGALGPELSRGAVVLAVDMPMAPVALLGHLADGPDESLVPRLADYAQPLCARYSSGALQTAAALASAGARSMKALLEAIAVRWLEGRDLEVLIAAGALEDIDDPAALERWIETGLQDRPGL
ncbi:MAG: molybdenum cofactor guanylyltransferase [Actinomycetota bacterium]